MSENAPRGKPGAMKGAGSSPSPQQLMEQLMGMLSEQDEGAKASVEERLDNLEARVDALTAKLEGADGSIPENTLKALNDSLADKLKTLINSLLLHSGFLEKLVAATVDRRLKAQGGEGGLDKEAVRKEIEACMGSDTVKEILDDKFRAITLYLKSDVIPAAVRQALSNPQT